MPINPLAFNPSRPPPLLVGGSLPLALAERVADCEHAQSHRLPRPPEANTPRLVPVSCRECRRAWALLECILGGFTLESPERAWLTAGLESELVARLQAITSGPAPLRELAAYLGLPYPGAPSPQSRLSPP